jgi:hypothetical protein
MQPEERFEALVLSPCQPPTAVNHRPSQEIDNACRVDRKTLSRVLEVLRVYR